MYIFLDIETRQDDNLVHIKKDNLKVPATYKDPEKIKAWIENKDIRKDMSVDPDYCELICIGVKPEGQHPRLMSLEEFGLYVDGFIASDNTVTFVTFNGKKFDFPAIMKLGLRNNIDLPYKELKALTARYNNHGLMQHIDLMEELGEYGQWKSLDQYLQIYLGISKKEIDFSTASIEEIKEHCLEDLINTDKLFNKFKPIVAK